MNKEKEGAKKMKMAINGFSRVSVVAMLVALVVSVCALVYGAITQSASFLDWALPSVLGLGVLAIIAQSRRK